MRKSEINAALRDYVRGHLSPTQEERAFVSKVYASVCSVLGEAQCIQIGSFARYTAIRPIHDLDVLYRLGPVPRTPDPAAALSELEERLRRRYVNPTKFDIRITRQSHSITIEFRQGAEVKFGVDIVPGYAVDKNEFGDDIYLVPEIAPHSHAARRQIYEQVAKRVEGMSWRKSDPQGYISVASQLNKINDDFRKAVKFVKAWRWAWKEKDENFALKSFHLEQILTQYFADSDEIEIYDAIFRFFCELPTLMERPTVPDRADHARYIDEYVAGLSRDDKTLIRSARDHFLITLENLTTPASISELLRPGTRVRCHPTEAYLFDGGIPVLTTERLRIQAMLLPRDGGFRGALLDSAGLIEVDRKIRFEVVGDALDADILKWKVKNDDNCSEPRGEISNHTTRNVPESTKYKGSHYVECYAIKNGVCIARARQPIVLKPLYG
ncbi:MAG: nucleotidyltransferase [Nitrosomonadales bacterium]|nr:nucleotidyltransferase [Nitrosomonadales bacterium]